MKLFRKPIRQISTCVTLVMLIALQIGLFAQEKDAGLQNPLHELGAGSRAFSLGRAYVALADDPTAVYWNPAGLEYVPRVSLTLFHTPLALSGASYDFLGFVYPTLSLGTIGVGFSRIGVGDILFTDEFNVTDGSTFTYDFSEIYIAYAKRVIWGLTPGVTFKVHRQSVSLVGQDNSAFGIDAGLIYRPDADAGILGNLSLGFHYQNLVKPELNFTANRDSLASQISFGLMKGFPVGLAGRLNLLFSYVQVQNGASTVHSGAEYQFRDLGTIRVGYDRSSPSFGAGVEYKFVNIDYAFGNMSTDNAFSASHRFSVTFNLGRSRTEKVLLAQESRKQRERELVENTKALERTSRIRSSMENGRDLLEKERFFEASVEFQRVIQDDPFNAQAQALFDSSQTMIQREFQKRQEEAVALAIDKEIAQKNQQQIDLYFERGRNYLQNKQFTDALIQFNQALELRPDDPVLQDAVATTKRQLSTEVRTLVQDARLRFRDGDFSGALQVLGEALVLSPEADEPETQALQNEINTLTRRIRLQQFTIRGLALLRAGEYQEALAVFEEALQLDPTNEAIRQFYDQTRLEMGARREKMDPESESEYAEAIDHFLAGRYDQALTIFRSLAEKYPYNKKLQDAINTVEDRIKRSKNQ